MSAARMVLLVSLLVLPGFPQQSRPKPTLPGQNWTLPPSIPPEPLRESDLRTLKLQAIHDDAEQLSSLAVTMQSDLQQLQKGMLVKSLADNLKKMEKLSKKLRQEVAP